MAVVSSVAALAALDPQLDLVGVVLVVPPVQAGVFARAGGWVMLLLGFLAIPSLGGPC